MRWAVAVTRSQQEDLAAQQVQKNGFEFFYPRLRTRFAGSWRLEPLFPGYLFVVVGTAWRKLLFETVGIFDVIRFDTVPALVHDKVVDVIRSRCDSGGVFIPAPKILQGSKVRIDKGPFAGELATVERLRGKDRADVLMRVLGHCSFDVSDLSVVT